jgi:hypothetical protein
MVSSNQTDTVKRLEAEGWTIVPAPDKLVLGGPIVMQRVTAQSVIDRIAVIPDGETISK